MPSIINVLLVSCSVSMLDNYFVESSGSTTLYPMHVLGAIYEGMELKTGLRISDLPSGVYGITSDINPLSSYAKSIELVALRHSPDHQHTAASVKEHLIVNAGEADLASHIAVILTGSDAGFTMRWALEYGHYSFVVFWMKGEDTANMFQVGSSNPTSVNSNTHITVWQHKYLVPMTNVGEVLKWSFPPGERVGQEKIEAEFNHQIMSLFKFSPNQTGFGKFIKRLFCLTC